MVLPGGGVVRIGRTHILVRPGSPPAPSDMAVPLRVLANSGIGADSATEIIRASLSLAVRVVVAGDHLPVDGRHLTRALIGKPVSTGDRVQIAAGYGGESGDPDSMDLVAVDPDEAAIVAQTTSFITEDESAVAPTTTHDEGRVIGDG